MADERTDDQEVQGALADATARGRGRLDRGPTALLATGLIGGIDVGIGVLAKLVVLEATGSHILGGLAFGIGFIALALGRSELFTENFLIPVATTIEERRSPMRLLRLWALTGLGNLAGGWVIMAIVVAGVPTIGQSDVLVETGGHFVGPGLWQLLASAVLGGTVITLMTWMESGADSEPAALVAVVAAAFVLAGTPLLHSVVSSLEIFGALQTSAPFGYLKWLEVFGISVAGNVLGGIGLVTVLRVVQARSEP